MVLEFINSVGIYAIVLSSTLGNFLIFLFSAIKVFLSKKLKIIKTLTQVEQIGVNSLAISILTGVFTGGVLALQSYEGFRRFGSEEFIGPVIAFAMLRELGPVLTGLMVAGRAGSAIAAEIGTMRITEQIDALQTLSINTYQYLVVPRILASTLIMPFLTLFAMAAGILSGYIVSVYVLHLNGEVYLSGIRQNVELSDMTGGLFKACIFGLILAWVGAYKGYTTRGGAKGVGKSTTQSVVISSIMILIANYFLTAMLFGV